MNIRAWSEDDFLSSEEHAGLKDHFLNSPLLKDKDFDWFGRKTITSAEEPLIHTLHTKLLERARQLFDSSTLLPSYSLFVDYSKDEISLFKHRDNNACTYTIDYCLYANEPWGLWIEDEEFISKENNAVMFYGEDQEHWRETKNGENKVGMLFFHYVEPDHWFYTKGSKHIDVIMEDYVQRVR